MGSLAQPLSGSSRLVERTRLVPLCRAAGLRRGGAERRTGEGSHLRCPVEEAWSAYRANRLG